MAQNVLLLLNLGTPTEPTKKGVSDYLKEFLLDHRVIDINPILRNLLVRCLIVPKRSKNAADIYKKIWMQDGSPLLVHSKEVQQALQQELGGAWDVRLAMRYQQPSLKSMLQELKKLPIKNLVLFPLFPQYASATIGSLYEVILRHISSWRSIPNLKVISDYSNHPCYIDALATTVAESAQEKSSPFDTILVSFHGLPERQVRAAYESCICSDACCRNQMNAPLCYRASCIKTFDAIRARFPKKQFKLCFQSRFGKEPWLGPDIQDVVKHMAESGIKRLAVLSPSFTTDCIETIYEIGYEVKEHFLRYGGEELYCFPSLNSSQPWVNAIKNVVQNSFKDV